MTLTRLQEILAAYGADPVRWPTAERDAALAVLRRLPVSVASDAETLDRLLDLTGERTLPSLGTDTLLAARIRTRALKTAQIAAPMPRGTTARFWPQATALAAALLVGIMIGISDLAGSYFSDSADLSSDFLDVTYWETWS